MSVTTESVPGRDVILPNGRWLQNVPQHSDLPRLRRMNRHVQLLVEPMLADSVHGWRIRGSGRSHFTAAAQIGGQQGERISFDIRSFFPSVEQSRLKRLVEGLDRGLWRTLNPYMPTYGLPEGCPFSPALANLYLCSIDKRFGEIVRYCDNIMISCDNPDRVLRALVSQLGDLGLRVHQVVRRPEKFCEVSIAAAVDGTSWPRRSR